jgi:tyrosyl-tRNA synthetase
MNTADEDVYRFLRYFTFLDLTDIGLIESADQVVQGRKSAQGVLASEVTRLVHGPLGVAAAERISAALFSGAINTLTAGDLDQLALDGMPCSTIERSTPMLEVLVDTGLAATPRGEVTLGQARKLVIDGAVAVNGETCRDTERILTKENAIYRRFHVLRRGKKTFHLLRWI